ncbi:hypothetical protein [Myxosarcina sp. GI1]|uniref:hypothetical protein n=1 Tax=Myxosarcina sp. GI1 TaxID=1541065 RepID=UPI000559E937|nr:hypothetical protein [Myxosarcina sp. GI1]
MYESKLAKDQKNYSSNKGKIARQHQEIATKCGEELIELGKSLQKQENPATELGKSLQAHGEKIQQYMQHEAQQAEEALKQVGERKADSRQSQETAAMYRRLATEEHTQAVYEYNQYLQQQIQENRQKIEQYKQQQQS